MASRFFSACFEAGSLGRLSDLTIGVLGLHTDVPYSNGFMWLSGS